MYELLNWFLQQAGWLQTLIAFIIFTLVSIAIIVVLATVEHFLFKVGLIDGDHPGRRSTDE